MSLRHALLLLACLAVAPPARAWEVEATESFAAEWHGDNGDGVPTNDDFALIKQKLSLGVVHDVYRLTGRWEWWQLFSEPSALKSWPDQGDLERGFAHGDGAALGRVARQGLVPEKVNLAVKARGVRLELGDFYQVLGRGFLLSLRKMDDLGVDTSLRGARLAVERRWWSLTAFGGFANPVNLDTSTLQRLDDPNDLLSGGAATLRLPIGLDLTAHGLFLAPRPLDDPRDGDTRERLWAVGGSATWASLGLYGEFDYLRRTQVAYLAGLDGALDGVEQPDGGHAAYLSLLRSMGPVTSLTELRWTDDCVVRGTPSAGDRARGVVFLYNTAPTLEKEDLRVEPFEEALGGRERLSLRLDALDAVLAGNYTRFFDTPHDGDHVDHVYGTWEQHLADNRVAVNAAGGWRLESAGQARPDKRLWYAEADVSFPLGHGHALDVSAHHEDWRNAWENLPEEAWREGTLGLTATLFQDFVAAAALDYSTRPTYDRDWFPSGSLEWKYAGGSSLKLFGGATRGGLRCVGGVCRVLPPFNGAWLQWIHRF